MIWQRVPIEHHRIMGTYVIDTSMGIGVFEHNSLQSNHMGFTYCPSMIGIIGYDYMSWL